MRGVEKRTAIDVCRELQRVGFDIKWNRRNTLTPHTGAETAAHWHVKAAICRRISELNDVFWTEVDSDRGIPDILRVKIDDERAFVYEVETGHDTERARQKAAQYTDDFTCSVVQECFVLDPLEAPSKLPELQAWVEEVVV